MFGYDPRQRPNESGCIADFRAGAEDLSANGTLGSLSIRWPGNAATGYRKPGNVVIGCR
jgi:hypothetical protein